MSQARHGFSASATRKLFNTIGMGGSAVSFLALAMVAPPNGDGHAPGVYAAAALLTLAVGLGTCASSAGYWASFVDLSRRHAQVLLGISNSIASLPGVGAGVVTGRLLKASGNDWRLMFLIAAAVQAVGALIFLLFADVREQHFDDPRHAHYSRSAPTVPAEESSAVVGLPSSVASRSERLLVNGP